MGETDDKNSLRKGKKGGKRKKRKNYLKAFHFLSSLPRCEFQLFLLYETL